MIYYPNYKLVLFLTEMPIVYILLTIITVLVIWLIIKNVRSKKGTFTLGKSNNELTIDVFNKLPFITLYYDFSYQLTGMNKIAKSHFTKINIIEDLYAKSLENVFKNVNLLNYLDELIVKEIPQQFQIELTTGINCYSYDATLMLAYASGRNNKQLTLTLYDTTSHNKKATNAQNLLNKKQEELTTIIAEKKEFEEQKLELEKAFKRSSKHHIQLQKALLENERQRKQLQEAVKVINQQKEELKNANEEIKHHARMKELFFANTSHEIRTPLNAIIGFTNLLLQMAPTNKQLGYLQNIKASGDNLLIVLNDILDFSKIEAGKMTFERISFLLTEQMNYLISVMKVKSDEKQLELKHCIDPNLPEVLIGDPTRLNQILMNLIGNSIKFTDTRGAIKLTINEESRTNNKVRIRFKVKDTGIGISKEKIKQIFNSFTQAENETTRKYGGTGLGLAIVKQLVELQNGEVFVQSKVGKGSTFTFFLTFTIGHFSSIRKQNTEQSNKLRNPENIHILIAEDNKINQQLAIDTIHNWEKNINIDIAKNGKEAIQKISEKHYHIVFMDIQMPEMDGMEATRYIRNKLPNNKKNTPIIAMTAHALKNERDHFIEVGMDDYLSKPFAPEVLIQKIAFYSSNHVQEKVKKGEKFKSILDRCTLETSELQTYNPNNKESNFKYLNLSYLNNIYKGDNKRITKILKMHIQLVQNEINEIEAAYNNKDWEKTRAKSHALKPKMNYLGCKNLFECAKNIEQTIKQNGDTKPLASDVQLLVNNWPKIEEEIKKYINN